MGKTNVSARNTSRKGFRLSAALRDEPGGLQERFSEKTTAVHPGWTRGQSDLLRSRQGSLSLITNKSDERWGGFRRTAAGGRTRIPSKQASRGSRGSFSASGISNPPRPKSLRTADFRAPLRLCQIHLDDSDEATLTTTHRHIAIPVSLPISPAPAHHEPLRHLE